MRETHRLGVPVIGLVDTNADPDEANFVIPGQRRRDPLVRPRRPRGRRRDRRRAVEGHDDREMASRREPAAGAEGPAEEAPERPRSRSSSPPRLPKGSESE